MATQVTIKLSPEQFDTLRQIIKEYEQDELDVANDEKEQPKSKSEARSRAIGANLLLQYLNRM